MYLCKKKTAFRLEFLHFVKLERHGELELETQKNVHFPDACATPLNLHID